MKGRIPDTRRFIRALAADLRPVRPIPRLGSVALGASLVWLAVGLAALAVRGLRPQLWAALTEHPALGAILVGLALVAVGGIGAGLAAGVPGRDVAVRGSLVAGALGVLLSVGVGGVLSMRGGAPLVPAPAVSADVSCLAVALLLSLPPARVALWFVARSAPHRRLLAGLFLATGSVALGAVVVHLSCDGIHPRHLILSHALAPVAGALLLTLPYRSALARGADRVWRG
ncbi:MAG: DUF1109 family protein [Deltaproteobacteria bacterium]|nr:MAG: DUF1109 family protein [Deltaproteobacteria bacterium]